LKLFVAAGVPVAVVGIVSIMLVYDAALIMELPLLVLLLLAIPLIAGRSFKSAREELTDLC